MWYFRSMDAMGIYVITTGIMDLLYFTKNHVLLMYLHFDGFFQCIDMTFKLLYWVHWNCGRNFHHAQAPGGSAISVKNAITEEDLRELKEKIHTSLVVGPRNSPFSIGGTRLTVAAWCILLCHLPTGVETCTGIARVGDLKWGKAFPEQMV